MAAANYTPIILYHSTTASAVPTAANLAQGELAININDGKLYYEDSSGVVQVLATKGTGTIGGSNTQVQYNSSGALAGSSNFTFDGTTATINTLNLTTVLDEIYGGTGLNSYTTGDLLYASGANTLAKLSIGTSTYILTSTGSVPQWSAPSSVTVATANNLAGGAVGSVPYQSGASTTTFLSIGTQNQVLTSTGSAPQWSSGLTITTLSTTGNTTLGDAAADNITINGTITSNLIFTDNTYDIGASGATRPRNLYLAGDATIGGSIAATTLDLTNLEVTNIKAKDGTASATIADSTGVMTIATLVGTNDATVNGITVGRGAGAVSSNTAVGAGALFSNTIGSENTALGGSALVSNTTGSINTAVGFFSLYSNTSGQQNSALGTGALTFNTTGSYNTAIGREALRANTTASNNTAVGYQAAYSNTTGNRLTAIGYLSGYANNSQYNVFVGSFAGYQNTGNSNTAIGDGTLYGSGNGSGNVAIGQAAIQSGTTGSYNVGIGLEAMVSTTTGNYNTAVGTYALRTNANSSNNTALGHQSLYNTTASNNTAVGYQSLYSNTTASFNVAVGYRALYSNTTGPYNYAFGYNALFSNTTGERNSAFGFSPLYSNTTGNYNVAMGHSALETNSTGSNNTALGYQSLLYNTTASNNTAVGYQAGYSNTTGVNNVAFGYQAGYSSVAAYGNVFIGNQAGYTSNAASTNGGNVCIGSGSGYSLTTGVGNTFVGGGNPAAVFPSGYYVTTGSKNTILGAYNGNQGGLDIRTANNYIVLSDGDGNPRAIADSSGNWGLGGVAPSGQRLYVAGGQIWHASNQYNVSPGTGIDYEMVNRDGRGWLFYTNAASNYGANITRYGIGLSNYFGTSGIGITFPATQDASSDANTLDDYEEGTWTPVLTDGTVSKSGTGTYTKIGNTVRISGYVSDAEDPSGFTGTVYMTGLPFNSGSVDTPIASFINYQTGTESWSAMTNPTTSQIRFYQVGVSGADYVNITGATINFYTDVYVGGTYYV